MTSADKLEWKNLSGLGQASIIGQGFSALNAGIGAYYASHAEKYKTKSQALQYKHQQDMALFNVRMKESQARWISGVFNHQYQTMTMKQRTAKSKATVGFAARGVQRGVGSTRDAMVSSDILASIDKLTMNSNRVRAVSDKRLEAVNTQIKADMYGLSASNMFATASNISPWMNVSSSLLTGGADFLSKLPEGMLRGD